MAYIAFAIRTYQPVAGRKYLFDANAWIYILEADLELTNNSGRKGIDYADLLQRIKQAGSPKPKVVLPALVLSEVVNRLLRSYYFPLFIQNHKTLLTPGSDAQNYKLVYRPHEQFKTDYGFILYNIKAYHNLIELISDGFDELAIKTVFNNTDATLDFNDWVLVQIARRNNYILVSDDGDMLGKDITVVTGNPKLLAGSPQ